MAGLLAWENLIDAPDTALSVKPNGIEDPAFPLANLQKRGKADAFRPNATGELFFTAMFGGNRKVNLVSLLGVQANKADFSGIEIKVQSWFTFDSSWHDIPESIVTGIAPLLRETMGEGIDIHIPIPAGDYDRLRVVVTGEVVAIARLWISAALVLADGIDAGWAMPFTDSGTLDKTAGNQWIESTGIRSRALRIPLESAANTTELAWGIDSTTHDFLPDNPPSLFRLAMEAGATGEVIALPRTLSQAWMRKTGIYGHIEQTWDINHHAGQYFGASLVVVEEH